MEIRVDALGWRPTNVGAAVLPSSRGAGTGRPAPGPSRFGRPHWPAFAPRLPGAGSGNAL
jgi:hypothetical protein